MSLVFVDQEKNSKNVVGLYNNIVKKNNKIIPAKGSSTIDPGDKLVMFVPVKSIKKVQELLSVRLDYF